MDTIKAVLDKYEFPLHVMEDYERFNKRKQEYLADPNDVTWSLLALAYDYIHNASKQEWVNGNISRQDFEELKEMVKEGLS